MRVHVSEICPHKHAQIINHILKIHPSNTQHDSERHLAEALQENNDFLQALMSRFEPLGQYPSSGVVSDLPTVSFREFHMHQENRRVEPIYFGLWDTIGIYTSAKLVKCTHFDLFLSCFHNNRPVKSSTSPRRKVMVLEEENAKLTVAAVS